MVIQTWGDILIASFQNLWQGFISFSPRFLGAIIIFIIGWIIAAALGKLVAQLIRALKIDQILQKLTFEKTLEKAGMNLDSGIFVGTLVKWFIIIVFLMASADIIGLSQVTEFLQDVLLYIPNVIVAALILLVAVLVAEAVQKLIQASVKAAGFVSAGLLSGIAKWAIWIFAILAALSQLGLAVPLINTLFTGIIAMLAIAGGIAFGLGGKDAAARFIDKLQKDISEHR